MAPVAVMANVLGGSGGGGANGLYGGYLHCLARDPALRIHAYGGVRPGRKVGHVTALGSDLAETLSRARHAASYLSGDDW